MPALTGFRTFNTQREAIDYHIQANFSWQKWQDLTDEEREGIYHYTGSWYREMNTSLREGYEDSRVTGMIQGATSGLSKFEAAEDVVTFRGGNMHWTANLLGGTEEQMSNAAFLRSRIGKTVVDKGFMSSGTHQDSAWTSDVKYTILIRKGVSGMYVDPVSANSGEYEFLFNRDTSFKVHAIRTGESGRIRELVIEAVPRKSKH